MSPLQLAVRPGSVGQLDAEGLVGASALAVVVAVACLGILLPLLRRYAVDTPNERSSHRVPTPRSGGLGILAGLGVGTAAAASAGVPAVPLSTVAGCLVLAALGLVDDLSSLSVRLRLGVQVLAAELIVTGVLRGEDWQANAVLLVPATVFVVGVVNATNFMDGINGISAMATIVACGWFLWLGISHDDAALVAVAALTLASTLGFLVWNVRGVVFLGDVGSYLLGAVMSTCALYAWDIGVTPLSAVAPLLVYAFDTAYTLVRRTHSGHSPGTAHRDHVYQRLAAAGPGHLVVAAGVASLVVAICLLALVFDRGDLPEQAASVVAIGALLAAYAALPRLTRARGERHVEPR